MNKLLAVILALLPLAAAESSPGTPKPATASPEAGTISAREKNSAEGWIKAGDALMQRAREGSPEDLASQAQALYERALSAEPSHVEAMVGLAWACNTRHQFVDGIRWAQRSLAVDARNTRAYALLSDAAVEIGDYEQALEYCQKALDLQPNLSTYSRAAHVVWITGNSTKAQWLMRKAIAAGGPRAENVAWCRTELALMLFHVGMLLPAEQEAQKALDLAPSNAHALATMGRLKLARRDYPAAIELFRKSIAAQPTHEALNGLVDTLELDGQTAEAARQASALIAFHTNALPTGTTNALTHAHGSGNAQLARFYADHNRDMDTALREALAAVESAPNVDALATLAWCQYKKGLNREAGKTMRKALQVGTPDASILFRAGMIQARLDRPAEAQQLLSRALSMNPGFHPRDAATAAATLTALSQAAHQRAESPVRPQALAP